jgi:hypothetical protein
MKYLLLVLAVFFVGCTSAPQKSNDLTYVSPGKYQIDNIARYARENKCKEYFIRGKFYCEDGRKFRAVHR